MRRGFIKYPPIVNFILGLLILLFCLYKILPSWIQTVAADAFIASSTPTEAVCDSIKPGLLFTDVTFSYEVNGEEYEVSFEDQTLGTEVLNLHEGSKWTIYVSNSDPTSAFLRESVYNEALNNARNKIYIRYGLLAIAAAVTLIYGIIGLIRKHQEKVNDRKFREAILNKSHSDSYSYTAPDIPPQPVYGAGMQQNSYSSSNYNANQPYSDPTYNANSTTSPTYGASQPTNVPEYHSPYSSEPSDGGYTSLDFSHLPPSKPMTINDDEFEAPRTIEPDDIPQTSYEQPFSTHNEQSESQQYSTYPPQPQSQQYSAAPSQPEPQQYNAPSQPEPQQYSAPSQSEPQRYNAPSQSEPQRYNAPSQPEPKAETASFAPIDTNDLSSIIKKGSDDPFNVSADDYQVDPSLAALIKKGSDDPFHQNTDNYEIDPSLEALIKKGSDDPFAGGLKKEKPKRRKKRPPQY